MTTNDSPTAGTLPADVFLTRLREQTAVSHKNLESLPVSASILSPGVSIAEYADYLGLMHDVVADLELRIFPYVANLVPDIESRRKLHVIEADLETLEAVKPENEMVFKRSGMTPAFAFGIVYVVEGSTLGGRFILKNIAAALGFDTTRGAQYFGGYGHKTGSRWKSFLKSMTDYAMANQCEDEIIAGADFGFRAINNHLSAYSPA